MQKKVSLKHFGSSALCAFCWLGCQKLRLTAVRTRSLWGLFASAVEQSQRIASDKSVNILFSSGDGTLLMGKAWQRVGGPSLPVIIGSCRGVWLLPTLR